VEYGPAQAALMTVLPVAFETAQLLLLPLSAEATLLAAWTHSKALLAKVRARACFCACACARARARACVGECRRAPKRWFALLVHSRCSH
jgi:hypothetical protein